MKLTTTCLTMTGHRTVLAVSIHIDFEWVITRDYDHILLVIKRLESSSAHCFSVLLQRIASAVLLLTETKKGKNRRINNLIVKMVCLHGEKSWVAFKTSEPSPSITLYPEFCCRSWLEVKADPTDNKRQTFSVQLGTFLRLFVFLWKLYFLVLKVVKFQPVVIIADLILICRTQYMFWDLYVYC